MAKNSKRKIWEKERRDHLKEAFIKLEKLLPSYDPSNAASRIDVITKSIEYIEEMRNIIQELLKPHSEVNPKVLKLKNLQDRIKRLVGRMEILSRLLREAKIPIPQAHKWKEFKQKNRKWSGKMNVNKSSILKDKVNEKNEQEQPDENLNEGSSTLMRNSPIKSKSNPSSLVPKHRKNIVNRVKTEAGTKQKALQPTTSNCVIIYTQAYNAPPCYLVNSGPSNNLAGTSKTVITNSLVASNPVMATNVKGSKKAVMDSSKIQPLGTGTLILTNGNLYPVLPQPQPILSTPMLLQVTNNSNATIKSDSDKKNENVNGKTVKSPKKNIKKSPKSNQPNQSNTVRKISIPDVRTTSNVISCGPNLVMSKNSQVLTAPMGKVPILPNIFAPKVPATISRKRVKGRRIGDKPVSRQALSGIRRMNKKVETEENESAPKKMKMDNSSADSTNNAKDIVDSGSNTVISELTSSEKLNSVKEVDDSKVQTTISIIADDVVKASNQNICSDVGNTSEITPSLKQTHLEISEGHNLLSNVTNNTSTESHTAEKEGPKNLTSNISEIDIRTSVPPKPPLLNSDNEIELKNMVENSEKAKLPEKSEKTNDEPKHDGPTSGQHINDEQNMRTDSNLDLDNVCSMNQQLNIHLGHSELSNDIFASLQVPTGCQNPESTSPTAAFLLAFPLVSSLTGVKVTEVMDEDNPDSQRETPTLLQIGNMDATKSTQSENFTPNLLNLDFFSSKDIYSGFYNSFEQHLSGLLPSTVSDSPKVVKNTSSKFGDNFRTSSLIDNIQPSKQNEMIVQTSKAQENSEVPNNREISTEIECQPNFSFVAKQSNTVITNRDRSNHIPPPMLYLEKPLGQGVSEKDTNISNCESMDVEKQKVEKVSVRNDQSNISKNNSSKVESSNKDNEKIFRNIMKVDTCQNIFNIGNINNDMNKPIGQIDNINFYPDKNKPALSRDFHLQNSTNKNIQGLFPDNPQETQFTYAANRNFLSTSMNFNEQNTSFGINNNASFAPKSMNVKNFNQQIDSSQKAVINPYFIPDNKNYSISNSNSNKTVDNRIPENQKYFTYNNFTVDSKKSLKTNEINSNYSVSNKIPPPVSKMVETKQITSNYAANYTNSTYDITNITKVCTCVYISNKPTSEPLYTNSNINNYNYYSNTENYLNDSCYKTVKNDKNVATDSENYTGYKKTDFNSTYYPDLRKNTVTTSKSESTQEKSTYNWMTTPTKTTSNHTVPSYSKEDMIYSNSNLVNSNQTSYFNSTSMYSNDLNTNLGQSTKKTFDLPLVNMNYQKSEVEESQNQFTWSPTKMPQFLDPVPSFVSSTLPTLVGDLALGSSNFTDQKYDFLNKTAKETKVKPSTKMGYENQNNFFSVSQLVHTNDKPASVKTVRRRNSGNGNKNNQTKNKKIIKNNEETKEISQCYNKSPGSQGNSKIENKNFNCRQANNNSFCDKRSSVKVSSSIYSAESLIGHQGHSEQDSKKDQSFSGNPMKNIPVPPYIPDNIMPYFPPVDLQQDNIMQQNQNYQNFPNFTTFSNNSYSSNTFIPSSTITTPYLSSSTFVPDIGVGNEYSSENINLFSNSTMNKIKIGTKNNTGHREDKNVHNNLCTDGVMKKKKKSANEIQSTTNLVDFSFLSVPGSINSPLLPDDFHSHSTFLPPPPTQPQLYPCKNTLYTPKQSTMTSTAPLLPLPPIPSVTRSVVHPEISPSLNSAGTSLTNFNLSTIFPEINKSSIGDIYSDNQAKEPSSDRHYPNSSVPFNAKSTFTYPNGPITQPYGIDNR